MHTPGEPAAPRAGRGRPRVLTASVYCGLFVVLLLLVMFSRGFSRDIGDSRIVGRYAIFPLFQSRVPEELTFTWNGLALHFGHSTTPGLAGVEPAGGSADIVFSGDFRLRLTTGADTGRSITLTPVNPVGAAAPLVVPFTVEGALLDPPAGSALAWRRAGRTFLLSLPPNARADAAAGTVTFPVSSAAWTAVLHTEGVTPGAFRAASARPAGAAGRLPAEAAMPSEDALHAAVTTYADAAYRAWSARLADGGPSLSEDFGVGFLAESVARGTWQKTFPLWADAFTRKQKLGAQPAPSYATSAYVGGTRDFMNGLRQRSAETIAKVSASLDRADNSVLLTRGLVTLVADHGSPELLEMRSRTPSGARRSGSTRSRPWVGRSSDSKLGMRASGVREFPLDLPELIDVIALQLGREVAKEVEGRTPAEVARSLSRYYAAHTMGQLGVVKERPLTLKVTGCFACTQDSPEIGRVMCPQLLRSVLETRLGQRWEVSKPDPTKHAARGCLFTATVA